MMSYATGSAANAAARIARTPIASRPGWQVATILADLTLLLCFQSEGVAAERHCPGTE